MFLYQQCSTNCSQRLVTVASHLRALRLNRNPIGDGSLAARRWCQNDALKTVPIQPGRSRRFPWRLKPLGAGGGAVLLAFSIKQFLGLDVMRQLDEDPLKDKVKQAMLHRKHANWAAAVEVLNTALKEAMETGNDLFVSRMYYELAITYLEAGELDNAEQLFLLLHNRYITLHRATGGSPEIIENSLKLADIYSRRGKLEDAEIALKFCLSRQLEVLDKHLGAYHVNKGADIEIRLPIETRDATYTDPIALFGMCLEDYAHFLVEHYSDTRLEEAEEYMKEALKTSYQIFGVNNVHSLSMISIFGAKCVLKNKFEAARRFLEIGINRVAMVPEADTILLSYYCSYTEALFHTGDHERAVDYAKRAARLAEASDTDPAVRKHMRRFARDIERDALRVMSRRGGGGGGSDNGGADNSNTARSKDDGDGGRTAAGWWTIWPFGNNK